MKTFTLKQAQADFQEIINYSLKTHDEINISSDNGAVIMIPQDDYDEMQETLRLLSDKLSLKALLEAHEARKNGEIPKSYSIKDVFCDL
ncbi:hypothetical protein BHECKSOX_2089 [Bathymodiolus heckerae thiotrophic gill symbiont]|uniref:type II toxin-antitoxin system Phd/YefM family antitoxin n=1 Tax=Bathymodiolus heckerae thiotrophic gill symbiont TaxID=1052212 RepID=UPI0010B629D5|nr:type II toxin-antitoxin system prevent-host-death family antitoxin [Bathymodiolus heckerae thiotrophic gill symbiont]SHN93045.1 hypothetical protein BHECKSOX_2089 [Bathymodiolus heckerae thiotrophic gill symbiont]